MRYFTGNGRDLGTVRALPQTGFAELCSQVLEKPIRLTLTRAGYHALPKRDKDAPNDQQRAKRVQYITPCTFRTDPAHRVYENAGACNLIALDVDSPQDAKRLLAQKWDDILGEFGYVVWHTASSTPTHPRLRVLVNAEGITREQYRSAVRTVAEMIGLAAVTTESRVIVQPMFLPVVFAGEDTNPIVGLHAEGEPFRSIDIIGDEETMMEQPGLPADPQRAAELEFLRTPMEGITLEDAREAVAALDPDMPMQQWIEVGAGLKHQFDSDEAFKIWDEWSAKGKKYTDAEDTRYRWNSLKANTPDRMPVTIRSVFRQAQARGWSNQKLARRYQQENFAWLKNPARTTEELLDEGPKRLAKMAGVVGTLERKVLMVALKDALAGREMALTLPDLKKAVRQIEIDAARSTGVPPWCKGLCFVTALNTFYRHTTDRRFAPEVLDLMHTAPSVSDDKPVRPRDYAIQLAGVPQVENLRYEPAQGGKRFFTENHVPYVNTYRPDYAAPQPDRAEEAGEVFMDHMVRLVGDADDRRTLIDWHAFLVQHPGKKIRWAPLIQGAEGCGKSVLAVAMTVCLGRRNVAKINGLDVMDSHFNNWAYGRQLVALEEVRIVGSNRHAVMDRLKPLITDDDISYHRKNEDIRTVPNITNYLLFTNYHDALAIREDGRRYFCLSSPLQSPEDIAAAGGKEHFDRLYGMLRDNPGGLRAWFEMWRISPNFNPEGRAPVTDYLREMAESASSPLMLAVRQCVEDEPHPLVRRDILSLGCLRASMETASLPPFSDQALAGVLRELGWVKFDRCMVDGAKHQLWTKGRVAGAREIASARSQLF